MPCLPSYNVNMQEPSRVLENYFVDEAGDPVFFDAKGNLIVGNPGCSKILIIGFIRTSDPKAIRNALRETKKKVENDKYLQSIPSITKTLEFFHAKDDCPEVRHIVYDAISKMKFRCEFVVARKDSVRFKKNHLGKESIFYNDIVSRLFQSRMHVSQASKIYLAVRGNKERQVPLSDAVTAAKTHFELEHDTKVSTYVEVLPQTMTGEPCLQVTDYMLWALYRAYTKGETRYLDFVQNKVSFIWDIYDLERQPKERRYHSRNKFDVKKISPL